MLRGVHYSGVSDKVYGEAIGIFRISVISWVSSIKGCLLSGIPLYYIMGSKMDREYVCMVLGI